LRSHDYIQKRLPAIRANFGKELLTIFSSNAFWIAVILVSLITGYSLVQATAIYASASDSAAGQMLLLKTINPLDGVLIPVFGGLYLASTFVFPFVAIRPLAAEKQSGSIKLSLQMPFGIAIGIALKLIAVLLAWLAMSLPVLVAAGFWASRGGHVFIPETLNLFLGHLLYGLAICGFALFVSSISDTTATAAIGVLALTLGCWILDFAGANSSDWLRSASKLSLTQGLRQFERGLLGVSQVAQLGIPAVSFVALAIIWIKPYWNQRAKLWRSAVAVFFATGLFAFLPSKSYTADLSEDRRNSFSREDEDAFRSMAADLRITIFLSPDDPRLVDLERKVFDRLRRIVPKISIRIASEGHALFKGTQDQYGYIVYEYGDRREKSRTNSGPDILKIIHGLAGHEIKSSGSNEYPGYPFSGHFDRWASIFYLLLPAICLMGRWVLQRPPNTKEFAV
jgi:ABC-2 type transport system permease protein